MKINTIENSYNPLIPKLYKYTEKKLFFYNISKLGNKKLSLEIRGEFFGSVAHSGNLWIHK